MKKMRLSIVIPAHNEEGNIKKLVTAFFRQYGSYINEIIVVNDGSTDQTRHIVELLTRKNKRIKLINRKPPNGVGLAIKAGIKKINKNSTHVLTLDADFIENVKDIKKFLKKIKSYDGLVGSRYLLPRSLVRYPAFKKLCNRSFHFLCRIVLGIKQKDLTNNFKFYKKEIFDKIKLTSKNFSVNAETGIYPIVQGYLIGEVPVKWIGRTASMGLSKFKILKVGPDYIRVLYLAIRMKYFKSVLTRRVR